MVSVCKLGGTINQTGVKGGKSKRSKIPPQSLSFSFSSRPRFSRFAAHHSLLDEPRDVRSIALKTLGKERDCSQSNFEKAFNEQLEHHNGGCTCTGYTSNFRNLVLEGNLFQVVVINNELPNPIQLNIETVSRHEIKCRCKFNLSVVS